MDELLLDFQEHYRWLIIVGPPRTDEELLGLQYVVLTIKHCARKSSANFSIRFSITSKTLSTTDGRTMLLAMCHKVGRKLTIDQSIIDASFSRRVL